MAKKKKNPGNTTKSQAVENHVKYRKKREIQIKPLREKQ